MQRDLDRICSAPLDVLVVGGGIHGAAVVCRAAEAGYRTAIVEKGDFCNATSANSLKILHGGLRYLQHGNIKRMRQSILSRREMMQLAPYLVRPLPCIMPLYGRGMRGKTVMRTALFVNDCISWDRNHGLPSGIRIPGGHIVSKEQCQEIIPGIASEDLHGGSVWYDVLALNTERLVLEYILAGSKYGAMTANYAEVTSVGKDGDLFTVTVEDKLAQRKCQLKAKNIVNASGPWFNRCFQNVPGCDPEKQRWAMALNIVARKRIFRDYAVALEGRGSYDDKDALIRRGKRLYFFVPWRGCTMIGTEYEETLDSPDAWKVGEETIRKMVDEVNAIYPSARLEYADISFYHAGLLPMYGSDGEGNVQLEKNSSVILHEHHGMKGVISIKGVKYTTAPHIAHEVVRLLQKQLQPGPAGDVTTGAPATARWDAGKRELKGLLEERYGRRAMRVLSYLDKASPGDIWIDRDAGLLEAEVRYLVAEEMACTLSDIVFRRTGLGTADCPPRKVLEKTAAVMGSILGWDEDRNKAEVEAVLGTYAPLLSKDSSA